VSVKGEIPSLFADLLRDKQVEVKKEAFLCLDFENSGVLLQNESFFDFDHVRALIIRSQPNKRVFVPAQAYFVLNSLAYKVFSLDEKQSTEDFKLIDYPEIFDELFTFAALLELYGDLGKPKHRAAVHQAVASGYRPEVIKTLLRSKGSVKGKAHVMLSGKNERRYFNGTVLEIAAQMKSPRIIFALLRNGGAR
jgi:hypothetical protein